MLRNHNKLLVIRGPSGDHVMQLTSEFPSGWQLGRCLLGRSFLVGITASVLWLASPSAADAQLSERVALTPTVGVAFPLGEVADYVLPGPTFGIRAMYDLSSRLAVGVEGNFDSHQGDPRTSYTIYTGPPFQALRYGVSVEASVLEPSPGGFTVTVGGGAGLASYFSEKLYDPSNPPIGTTVGGAGQTEFSSNPIQFSGSSLAFNGRLGVAYVYSESMSLFVEGQYYRASVDEDKTEVFVQGPYPVAKIDETGEKITFDIHGPLSTFGSMSSVVVRLGFRKHF